MSVNIGISSHFFRIVLLSFPKSHQDGEIVSNQMRRPQQVVDFLDGVECGRRHVNEYCVPVAHGSVPETWKLKRYQIAAVNAFLRDETRLAVDELGEVEFTSLIVFESAH